MSSMMRDANCFCQRIKNRGETERGIAKERGKVFSRKWKVGKELEFIFNMTDWEMVELGGVKIGKKSFNWVSAAAQGRQKKTIFSDLGFSS